MTLFYGHCTIYKLSCTIYGHRTIHGHCTICGHRTIHAYQNTTQVTIKTAIICDFCRFVRISDFILWIADSTLWIPDSKPNKYGFWINYSVHWARAMKY